jgi:hypothetical protein
MTRVASTLPSTKVRGMLGHDLDWWNTAMLLSLGAGALAAFAIVVTTTAVVRLQALDAADAKIEFDEYKLGVDARVEEAKKEGIEAGKTAGNAVLRAAELEKEAATARLETEKLKAVVAWRTISQSDTTALEKVLAANPGSVNLRWQDGDPEALFLAIQISQVLGKANWQVGGGSFKPANSILFGVVLPPDSGADADTLRQALTAAHIPFSSVPISQAGASFNVSTIAGAPFLMIGSRMPVLP